MAGQWFSLGTSVSSNNKNDRHDITEILLKVALNTIPPFVVLISNYVVEKQNGAQNTKSYRNFPLKGQSDIENRRNYAQQNYIFYA